MSCEDFPCCGHYEPSTGEAFCPTEDGQIDCVECGRLFLPRGSSICPRCLNRMAWRSDRDPWGDEGDWGDDY